MATPTSLPATFVAASVLTAQQMNDLRGAFRILQVVSTTKTDIFTASTAGGAQSAVTGFTVSITPSSTSSKILVLASINSGDTLGNATQYTVLTRGGSAIFIGDTAGSRQRASGGGGGVNRMTTTHLSYLDSPASTSAQTYGISIGHGTTTTQSCTINYGGDNADASYNARGASSITVMEISA
jgi:hypothetical protein